VSFTLQEDLYDGWITNASPILYGWHEDHTGASTGRRMKRRCAVVRVYCVSREGTIAAAAGERDGLTGVVVLMLEMASV
jgi:hypothetical protein